MTRNVAFSIAVAAAFTLAGCEKASEEPKAPAYWVANPDKIAPAIKRCEAGTMSAEACSMVYRARAYQESEARREVYRRNTGQEQGN